MNKELLKLKTGIDVLKKIFPNQWNKALFGITN